MAAQPGAEGEGAARMRVHWGRWEASRREPASRDSSWLSQQHARRGLVAVVSEALASTGGGGGGEDAGVLGALGGESQGAYGSKKWMVRACCLP
jgi:hypothetical protein